MGGAGAQHHAADPAKAVDSYLNAHGSRSFTNGIYQTYGTLGIICIFLGKCNPKMRKIFPAEGNKTAGRQDSTENDKLLVFWVGVCYSEGEDRRRPVRFFRVWYGGVSAMVTERKTSADEIGEGP
jgi:hypothetical protein